MKATGVVRRIDDLGRIVIPIEIRRSMKIRDGDPLEIYVDREGEVILKKYSAIQGLLPYVREIAATLHESSELTCLVSDRDRVVVAAGPDDREYSGRPIGPIVQRAMEERRMLLFTPDNHQHVGALIGEDEQAVCPFAAEVIAPIVSAGDPMGAVILCTRDPENEIGETECKLAETAAGFLARQMEE